MGDWRWIYRRTHAMKKTSFFKTGHLPTLAAAFLYFDVSFMIWVLLGPLAPFLADQMRLSATEKGLLTAIPLLGGSIFRPILGILGDRIGRKKTGLLGLALTIVPLFVGWRFAHTLSEFYLIGLLFGIGGASFAVALPLAGGWYPPEKQGLVMGIAGAGNSGTLLATFYAPRLAQHFGWATTFGFAALPVFAVFCLFALLAKDSPRKTDQPGPKEYLAVLREADAAWFCFFYAFTFGGFVGLTSFLTVFFHDQFGLSKVQAGDYTTLVVLAGSFLRPVGGWIADKIGGYKLLMILLSMLGFCLASIGALHVLSIVVAVLFLAMAMLGMGNGSVFQLVPQRFPSRMGILTGVVGAAGGLGGFFLPSVLGAIKDWTGQYSVGFFLFGAAFIVAALTLLQLGKAWHLTWPKAAAARAGIFSYRAPRSVTPQLAEESAD
jgi:MFS transporter, NNP family, nitrate/nitrite transporter